MITTLDHIQLSMPPEREGDARMFFSGLLSMVEEIKPEPLASRGGCWFRSGPAVIHIGVQKDFVAQKKAHPALCVHDLLLVSQALTAAGHGVVPDDSLFNRNHIYTHDPFRNRIELIQDGKGFSQK